MPASSGIAARPPYVQAMKALKKRQTARLAYLVAGLALLALNILQLTYISTGHQLPVAIPAIAFLASVLYVVKAVSLSQEGRRA